VEHLLRFWSWFIGVEMSEIVMPEPSYMALIVGLAFIEWVSWRVFVWRIEKRYKTVGLWWYFGVMPKLDGKVDIFYREEVQERFYRRYKGVK